MSKTHSPTHFNGETDNLFDSNFTVDINKRMQVPKSIRVNSDEDIDRTWNKMSMSTEKFEMHVPDRILVVGKALFCDIIIFHLSQNYFT
jgi:hypothetical protein